MRIVGFERDRTFENSCRRIELLQADQASCVCMETVELRIQKIARGFEVSDGRFAVSVPVVKHRDHSVAHRVAWTQPQNVLQERNSLHAVSFVMKLRLLLKRGQMIRSQLQRVAKRGEQ